MMKQMALILLAAAAVTSTTAQTKKPVAKPAVNPAKKIVATPILKNSVDSFSYAAGASIAMSMKQQGVSKINGALLQRAIEDQLNNKPSLMSDEQANMTLQQKLQEFAMKKTNVEKEKGKLFCQEQAKKPGVTVLPNGLQYEVITAGDPTGVKPLATDQVVVHYRGTLTDGTQFDASYDRGEPATFGLNQVIRGWTEILQLMTPGSKWKVTIPSDLAYGDMGRAPQIPGGATLLFDIELLEVKPTAN